MAAKKNSGTPRTKSGNLSPSHKKSASSLPPVQPKIIRLDEMSRLNEIFYSIISALFIMGVGLILFFNVEFTSPVTKTIIGAVLFCMGFLYALIEYQKIIEGRK